MSRLGLLRAHLHGDGRRRRPRPASGAWVVDGPEAGRPARAGRGHQPGREEEGQGSAAHGSSVPVGPSAPGRPGPRQRRRLQHPHQLHVLGHGEEVEGPQRPERPPGVQRPPAGPGRTGPARTTRRPSGEAAGRGRRGPPSRPGPPRPGPGRARRGPGDPAGAPPGRGSRRPARSPPARSPAVLRLRSATAGPLRSTATTVPAGPTARARATVNRPAPAYRSATRSPGRASEALQDHPGQGGRGRGMHLPEHAGPHLEPVAADLDVDMVGRPQRPALPHEAGVELGQAVEAVLARLDQDHRHVRRRARRRPRPGGHPARPPTRRRPRPPRRWRSDSGRPARCRGSGGDAGRSPPSGPTAKATRVRHAESARCPVDLLDLDPQVEAGQPGQLLGHQVLLQAALGRQGDVLEVASAAPSRPGVGTHAARPGRATAPGPRWRRPAGTTRPRR